MQGATIKIVKSCFHFVIDVLRPRSGALYVWSSLHTLRCRSIQKETSNILLQDSRDKVTMFETSLALIKHFSSLVILHQVGGLAMLINTKSIRNTYYCQQSYAYSIRHVGRTRLQLFPDNLTYKQIIAVKKYIN